MITHSGQHVASSWLARIPSFGHFLPCPIPIWRNSRMPGSTKSQSSAYSPNHPPSFGWVQAMPWLVRRIHQKRRGQEALSAVCTTAESWSCGWRLAHQQDGREGCMMRPSWHGYPTG